MSLKVFLDMDGVITDFFNACLRKHGCDEWNEQNWPQEYDIPKVIGLSHNEFWKPIDDYFWQYEVNLYDHAHRLIDLVRSHGIKPCLLTSPNISGATGKQLFIKKHLPEFFKEKRYLIGPAKNYCASPDAMLIDDSENNVEGFIQHGGNGWLFPRPWNSKRNKTLTTDFLNLSHKISELCGR